MKLHARTPPALRKAIDAFTRKRGLTVSEALRTLVVRGLDGSETEARELNALMAAARARVLGSLDVAPRPGSRRKSGSTVSVRLPRKLSQEVVAGGGLRAVLEAGLEHVGVAL